MLVQDIIEQAKQINVTDLISRYVSLNRASSHEWQGGCPKCGGDDRLHCTAEWWFCRQCHTKRGDAIEFVRWLDGSTFQAAMEKLTNQPWPERKNLVTTRNNSPRPDEREESWFEDAAALMKQHQSALLDYPNRGDDYLRSRGLERATWEAFGLGYHPAALNRDTHEEMPAIAMPWFRGGQLTAIRYRFLNPTGKQKITSIAGSRFSNVLFGGQALPEWVAMPPAQGERGSERFCTLLICEGEINAMSIWQVAHSSNVHVVSVGSETSRLSPGALALAKRYGKVIIWMDKVELVKHLVGELPGTFGYSSPEGQDANDLLRQGKLGGILTALRWDITRSDEERRRLYYDLWDARQRGELDESTTAAFEKIARHMGLQP